MHKNVFIYLFSKLVFLSFYLKEKYHWEEVKKLQGRDNVFF